MNIFKVSLMVINGTIFSMSAMGSGIVQNIITKYPRVQPTIQKAVQILPKSKTSLLIISGGISLATWQYKRAQYYNSIEELNKSIADKRKIKTNLKKYVSELTFSQQKSDGSSEYIIKDSELRRGICTFLYHDLRSIRYNIWENKKAKAKAEFRYDLLTPTNWGKNK